MSKMESGQGSRHAYVAGYFLSLSLTLVAFALTNRHVNSGHTFIEDNYMVFILGGLAITQLFVQLVFFLHLDKQSKPRWNSTVLAFAVVVVVIICFGSIWIMSNLNNHHYGFGNTHTGHELQTPQQTNQYIIKDEGISK